MSQSVDSQAAPADPPKPDENARYESLLATGERVLLVRRRHWITFVQAARWFVLALVLGVLAGATDGQISDHGVAGFFSTVLNWGFWIFVLIGLAGVGWYFLAWQRERYLVTTRRFIEVGGVINKHQRDTSLSMITDMIVGHPWIGRILGYGEIDLLTASEVGTNKVRFLPDADGFKKVLLDAKYEHELEVGGGQTAHEALAAPPAPVPAPVPAPAAAPVPAPPPAAERLTADEVDASVTRLAAMRDRGLITPEEFEEKKRDILDRL